MLLIHVFFSVTEWNGWTKSMDKNKRNNTGGLTCASITICILSEVVRQISFAQIIHASS